VNRAIVFALCAVALGPWVAAIWATGGYTQGGSPRWLRRVVVGLFFVLLFSALVRAGAA
jgi:hypothetical protein